MRAIKFTILLLCLITSVYGQNSLTINDLEAGPGDSTKIVIGLDNTDNISGFQIKIKVPANLIVEETGVSFVGRNSDHVIYPQALGNGEYLFLCFSGSNANFSGQTGDLIEIPVEIPLTYIPGETYEMIFTEAIVSSSNGEDIGSNHENGELIIIEGITPDLQVQAITTSQNDILPNDLYSISWEVQNIGLAAAIGGWIEQISLVSQTNGKKYIIGNASYDNDLLDNVSVSRNIEVTIPSIIGFHGDVKIEVALITNSEVNEPISKKDNNTAISVEIKNLLKRLFFTLDKPEIVESSNDSIRLNVARSGETNLDEVFTISSDLDNTFNLPSNIIINTDESSNFLFIKPIDNSTYDGDRPIALVVNGASYGDENVNLNLLDDENVMLTIDYPEDYSSAIGSIIPFTLNTNYIVNQDQIILISTDQSERLQLPSEIILTGGSNTTIFEGTILDTGEIEKSETVNVFAMAEGYTTGIKEIMLSSINIPNFTLTIEPGEISEGDGIRATYATLIKTNHIDKGTTVQINANINDQLILPSEILFEEGEFEKIFNIGAVDNSLVEGDRTITVTSQIKFEGCSCTDSNDPTTSVSQDISILDNDGLALTLKVSPSTMKAGAINNKLLVSRNTNNPDILQNPVNVNLSSDFPSIVVLPSTVTIPVDQQEIEIEFNTNVDPNQTDDKNIRIQAEASNYSTGYGWVLISNQNKPDAIITEISTGTSVEAGSIITVNSSIKNQGNDIYPAQTKIDYYLSKNRSLGDEEPFVSSIINKSIEVDETYMYEEEIQLPNLSGDNFLIVAINTDYSIGELDYLNNQYELPISISPSYTVDVVLDKAVYATNEAVIVSGTAITSGGSPVPNTDVLLKIENEEFERKYDIKTDANGTFVFEYVPLDNESGSYQVTATFPGEDILPQESFELLGFEIINKPQYIIWETVVGESLGKELTIKNKTNTTLTGVSIQVPDNGGFSIDQTPVNIDPGATINFPFTIVPTVASAELKYYEFIMVIQSNEGATYSELSYYYCKDQEAKLVATPLSINTTMVKDQTRLYEVTVRNVGAIDAENVVVLLPDLDWLRLNSQKIIESIKPDEEIKIVLELEPTVKEQVNVPINGNFVLTQNTGQPVSIPFRLETVSESTGKLIIDAVDEYTYNTVSAPHLKDASVVVKHPFTGEIIAEGITDEFGLFEVPQINEGWYVVNISAEKHYPYQNNILVDPGKDTKVTAFLPYQAITYSWNVIETEVLDEYDITLNVDFETNVPLPVVVMELDNPILDLNPGESRMTYITATNHGLIAVENISLTVSEPDDYSISPLITSLQKLNAKSAITIPVLVKNIEDTGRFSSTSGGGCGGGGVNLRGFFNCNGERSTTAGAAYMVTAASYGAAAYVAAACGTPGGSPGDNTCGCWRPGDPSGGGVGPSVRSGGSVTGLDLCDPCLTGAISAVWDCLTCIKAVGELNDKLEKLGCAINVAASSNLSELKDAILDCSGLSSIDDILDDAIGEIPVIGDLKCAFDCGWGIGTVVNDCIIDPLIWGDSNRQENTETYNNTESYRNNQSANSIWELIAEDFEQITIAITAHNNMISEYINNPNLESNDLNLLILHAVIQIDNQEEFTPEEIQTIKENLENTSITESYIDNFVIRWNNTVEAWNLNIFSPNTQYPNIVDKVKIDEYKERKADLITYAFTRGYVSVADMYYSDFEAFDEYVKAKSEDTESVCATVSLEFPQKLTMTRQAFEGILKINNSSSLDVTEVHLELLVNDENGENKTHLFQINKEEFLNGGGNVNPDSDGQGLVTFIPTKEAAPEVTQSYFFGGILSYFDPDIGETVNITLNPVALEVNPSPDLVLHYFMQRDILGDDPLTDDIVEPSLPAELSLMIQNDGFGLAKNVNVESMQPKIVENEKGLLVDFNMIGSNFNNEPTQLGLLNVGFGDIEAKQTAVGQWFFTSSLIGHFVSYDVSVNHTSSYGNENLSLIKASYIHELVRSVKSYGNNSDEIADFLVNDISDVYDTPDMIYLSDGTPVEVSKAEAVTILDQVTPATLTSKIKINPSTTGWNYGNILDESVEHYKLTRVTRDSDNFEIPLQNFWQTQVTLKDGLNPKYENKLHVLDKITDVETYTLNFIPIDGDIPEVVNFIDPPEPYNSVSINIVTVEFNKEIDFNTFTNANIELIHQGVPLASDDILIGKINATTYSINIEGLTNQSGFYELTVNTLGIRDLVGNEGQNGKKIDWVQFNSELGILKFETDQLKKNPINSINVIFNKPIRSEEFTSDEITINDTSVEELTIQKIDEYTYMISGIYPFNEDNGDYTISIDVTKIKAVDGNSGLAIQTHDWMVDNNLPKVVNIETLSQGASNTQIVTEIEIELNRALVSNLEASSFNFTKNGQELSIPIIIHKNDDLNYSIYGLETYTADNGTYLLTIDQSDFKDENDNFGEGIAEKSWTVLIEPLTALSNVKLAPDRGILDSDNITSGNDVQLVYETLIDNITVEVYELFGSSEVLIDKQFRSLTSEYSILLNDHVGAKKFKVVAYDDFGNRSNAEIITAYIDFTDIVTEILPVNEIINDCTDFDYVEVTFSEDISENIVFKDAITIKSNDLIIPKEDVVVTRESDKKFILENIQNPEDGSIVLEIDKTQISKKISGLNGFFTESIDLGSPNQYPVTINGEGEPEIDVEYEYIADDNMNKYDWIILNGEILSTDSNKVTVKWNKLDSQTLILRYLTPLNCTLTSGIEVMVNNGPLSTTDNEGKIERNFISPVPNDGQFTIHTNIILNDCTLSIFEITGKLVHQENHVDLSGKVKNVDVNLNSGIYFLILHNFEEKLKFKFLIK